ncbi:replication initiator [Micromonospora citrea]|uniref:replication initiator n=1 Tax=Micromonospora citrea TaxID=47855 RepID=UPI003CCC4477
MERPTGRRPGRRGPLAGRLDVPHPHPRLLRPCPHRRHLRQPRRLQLPTRRLDAVHFPRLLDRFWQNLRRAVGWNIQYAGAVEPQRRLAPHAHFAIRGTIPRALVRQVAAATYHQVWWPSVDVRVYEPGRAPQWNADAGGYTDPDSGDLLPTWDDALNQVDVDPDAEPDAEPVHVVRFGAQVDAKGVLAGTKDADRCVGYITSYLTKQAADCHDATTGRQRAHLERLWQELRHTPCSERCANWLLYGVQPKKARPGLKPGNCKNKVHKRETLGIGGRRVLISRQWSGKTLADHRADRKEWVKALLVVTTDADTAPAGSAQRHAWELARPTDPDVPPWATGSYAPSPNASNGAHNSTPPDAIRHGPVFGNCDRGGSYMKARTIEPPWTAEGASALLAASGTAGSAAASMTLDVYADLFGDDLDAVANRLDEAAAARDADHLRTGTVSGGVADLGKRRRPVVDLGFFTEPPDGIEPSTYALRVGCLRHAQRQGGRGGSSKQSRGYGRRPRPGVDGAGAACPPARSMSLRHATQQRH